ncbi:hypothetical protein KVP10_15955 [Candidimonas humi]|uniref:Uncharacterized protein n=1 Tax=Candidimonas humi TaxID=683355 RepID=A0ABV8NZE2_9BURK|nr:hypothetical protein [Candidimonas humi]MBV6306387.1 hypothetical protein [Candidimonas humi]
MRVAGLAVRVCWTGLLKLLAIFKQYIDLVNYHAIGHAVGKHAAPDAPRMPPLQYGLPQPREYGAGADHGSNMFPAIFSIWEARQ